MAVNKNAGAAVFVHTAEGLKRISGDRRLGSVTLEPFWFLYKPIIDAVPSIAAAPRIILYDSKIVGASPFFRTVGKAAVVEPSSRWPSHRARSLRLCLR